MNFFDDIKLKVKNKISNWQHKHFSSGGKEVIIKVITQAIPTYAMSMFKTPLGLCEDIQKLLLDFGGDLRMTREAFTGLSGRE